MTTNTADRRLVDAGQAGWLPDIARQIADEAGLQLTADIEDLVAIAYDGLLDTPNAEPLTRQTLLRRCRANLVVWVWELGTDHHPLPRSDLFRPPRQASPPTVPPHCNPSNSDRRRTR